MTYKKLINKLNLEYKGARLFKFDFCTYSYLILGYPNLRGFVSANENDFWVEVQPVINLNKREIVFPNDDGGERLLSSNVAIKKNKVSINKVSKTHLHKKLEKEFFQTLPEDKLKYISIYYDCHWEFLKAITYYDKYLIDFIVSNNAIAYILVNLDKFNRSYSLYNSMNFLNVAIGNRQKEILRRALFPDTQQMVKILSKLDTQLLNVHDLVSFRDYFAKNPELMTRAGNLFSHIKVINNNLIKILSSEPNLVSFLTVNTLQVLTDNIEYERLFPIVKGIYADSVKWKIKIPEITDITLIDRVRRNIDAAIKRKTDEIVKYPDPLLPGNEFIVPILNPIELISWGKKQRNCIATYENKIQTRNCSIYKVIDSQSEATLEIKNSNGKIYKGSFLGPNNLKASENLKLIVDQWWKENKRRNKEL